jgi:MFS family permease
MDQHRSPAVAEWRSGWTLVLASSIGFSFYSVMIGSLGLFMEPLDNEFGWSRALLSSGPGIATAITALLSPFFGMVIDRVGTRRLVLPGLVLTIAAMMGFSLLGGTQWQWLALWVFYGFVSTSIKSTSWTAAVIGVFTAARGLALGFTYAGTALTAILVPPIGNWLITEFGWRSAGEGSRCCSACSSSSIFMTARPPGAKTSQAVHSSRKSSTCPASPYARRGAIRHSGASHYRSSW